MTKMSASFMENIIHAPFMLMTTCDPLQGTLFQTYPSFPFFIVAIETSVHILPKV